MTKIAEFAISVDLDEVAHYEPPHLDLHCLTSQHDIAFLKICGRKFCHLLFGSLRVKDTYIKICLTLEI